MDARDYQDDALVTAAEYGSSMDMLHNAVLGLCGESGEIADAMKKHVFQGHTLDEDKLIEELGDVLWYCALMAKALGCDLASVMRLNIAKLRRRYPDGFSVERSVNRGEK